MPRWRDRTTAIGHHWRRPAFVYSHTSSQASARRGRRTAPTAGTRARARVLSVLHRLALGHTSDAHMRHTHVVPYQNNDADRLVQRLDSCGHPRHPAGPKESVSQVTNCLTDRQSPQCVNTVDDNPDFPRSANASPHQRRNCRSQSFNAKRGGYTSEGGRNSTPRARYRTPKQRYISEGSTTPQRGYLRSSTRDRENNLCEQHRRNRQSPPPRTTQACGNQTIICLENHASE